MARLILLDRDGVVNFDSPDYIKDAGEWVPIPGSLEAIVALRKGGFKVAICTNQAGVGRGILSLSALCAIHDKLHDSLRRLGGELDALTYCPHHPDDGCRCRKPAPGMLLDTMAELHAEPSESTFVGDSLKDIEAARAAGCAAVLVRTGNGRDTESAARALGAEVFDDLSAFSRALLSSS